MLHAQCASGCVADFPRVLRFLSGPPALLWCFPSMTPCSTYTRASYAAGSAGLGLLQPLPPFRTCSWGHYSFPARWFLFLRCFACERLALSVVTWIAVLRDHRASGFAWVSLSEGASLSLNCSACRIWWVLLGFKGRKRSSSLKVVTTFALCE